MSVYRPANSPWFHYDFVLKGRRFHGSTGVASKRAAERIEQRVRLDAAEGRLGDGAQLSVDDAAERWWIEVGQHRSHPDKIASRLDNMVAAVGKDLRLAEIDQGVVAEAIERRRGMAYVRSPAADARQRLPSNATVNNDVIDTLRKVLRRAASHWRARGLPEIDWAALRLDAPPETVRVYAAEEEARWLDECERTGWVVTRDGKRPGARAADVRLALELMLVNGLRFGELFFDPSAFDPAGPRLVWAKGRKGDVPMMAPLLADQARQVAARVGRAIAAGLDHIWFYERVDKEGEVELVPIPRAGLEARLSRAADRAQVPPGRRIHGARHHAGTTVYRATGDIRVVQQLLGHRDLKSTQRYVHAADDAVRAALERAQDARTPAPVEPVTKKAAT